MRPCVCFCCKFTDIQVWEAHSKNDRNPWAHSSSGQRTVTRIVTRLSRLTGTERTIEKVEGRLLSRLVADGPQ